MVPNSISLPSQREDLEGRLCRVKLLQLSYCYTNLGILRQTAMNKLLLYHPSSQREDLGTPITEFLIGKKSVDRALRTKNASPKGEHVAHWAVPNHLSTICH